ncbi:hypothetical protein ATG66_0266 [Vibrio sp. ES.051]|uniref:hypothetical protein n=1 Tax=Vibrio sp. ES.051 TaxID=1761909 RepID=UPI000BF987BA|nr:hypothetical protein [Vibrio sp. ES.051]PFG57770.1 hypothetical protein ATG66_0266 [Vibrio sp. ES.051]
MNNSKLVGFMGGTIVLLSTLILFGSSVHAAWYKIPAEAFHGLAFTLAFGLGLNSILAHVAAFITLVALFYIGFIASYRTYQKFK